MEDFQTEKEYILEEGDMLYLPSHVGHYGIAMSDECITYSFGYRSYQSQEMWDSFGEYLAEKNRVNGCTTIPTGLLSMLALNYRRLPGKMRKN